MLKSNPFFALAKTMVPLLAVMALAACGKEDPPVLPDPRDRWAQEAGPQGDLAIMDQAMDGSSIAAFEADMDAVREQAGQRAYDQLNGAIGYMLTYDLALNRDKAKLYRRLDGKTPNQVIAQSRGG